jgi:ubiquinone/menaquinone biosynthesis C-methylase UbiE
MKIGIERVVKRISGRNNLFAQLVILAVLLIFHNNWKVLCAGLCFILAFNLILAYELYFIIKPARNKQFEKHNELASSITLETIERHEDELARRFFKDTIEWTDPRQSPLSNCFSDIRHEYIGKYLDLEKACSWVDIGCFNGRLLAQHYNGKVSIAGVEISRERLNTAQRRFRELGIPFCAKHASATALPFCDNSFDRATLTDVLEHIPNWTMALDEIRRILNPGGIIVITTPNASACLMFNPFAIMESYLSSKNPKRLGTRPLVSDHKASESDEIDSRLTIEGNRYVFHRDFTPSEVEAELKNLGFAICVSKSFGFPPGASFLWRLSRGSKRAISFLFWVMSDLLPIMPATRYLSDELIIVAKKG